MSNAALAFEGAGLVLGRYRPLRPLGSGGSGSVWLARDEQTGLDVALKIVPREGKAAARAEREAEAAARLRHPSCLRAYAFARDPRHVYIAYEFVPGRTFREALRAGDLDDARRDRGLRADLRRPRARARGRDPAPRRQAVERPARRGDRVSVAAPRLRPRAHGRGGDADRAGRRARDARVHLARAARGRGRERGRRRLGGRRDALGVARGPASVLADARCSRRRARSSRARSRLRRCGPTCRRGCSSSSTARSRSARRAGRRPSSSPHSLRGAAAPRRKPRADAASASPCPARPAAQAPRRSPPRFAGWTAAALPFFRARGGSCSPLARGRGHARSRRGSGSRSRSPCRSCRSGTSRSASRSSTRRAPPLWLVLCWREPRGALLFALGPLLAPLAALGLLPLAAAGLRARRRAARAQAALGVLAAAIVAGIRARAARRSPAPRPPLGVGVGRRRRGRLRRRRLARCGPRPRIRRSSSRRALFAVVAARPPVRRRPAAAGARPASAPRCSPRRVLAAPSASAIPLVARRLADRGGASWFAPTRVA